MTEKTLATLREEVDALDTRIRSLAQQHAMDPAAALAIYASISRETVVAHRLQGVRPNG